MFSRRLKLVLISLALICVALGPATQAAPATKQSPTQPNEFVPKTTRYELDLAGRLYKPRDIIKLKRLVLQQYPEARLTLGKAQIRRVEVSAKSRLGKGRIALRIGNAISEPATIPGTEAKFASTDPDTYSNVELTNNSADHRGKWQIFVGGYIKFQRLVLEVAPRDTEI